MADADALIDSGVPVPVIPEPSPPAAAPGDDTVMSLVDHLGELRTRLFRAILAVAVGSVIGFIVAPEVRNAIVELLPTKHRPGPGPRRRVHDPDPDRRRDRRRPRDARPALPGLGVHLAGLDPAERKAIRPWVPLALLFFALGVGIAVLVLPYATEFLLSFTDDVFVANIAAGPYFDFVTTMFLAFGLVIEFPILLYGLARAGILSSDRLRASRRYVILLGIAIFAAVATPGGDLVSPIVLGGTMYLLFEATVFVIRRTGR